MGMVVAAPPPGLTESHHDSARRSSGYFGCYRRPSLRKGDLTLHGTTRPVTLDVTIVRIGTNPRTNLPTVGFGGTTILKRSDFGMGKYVPQVSDEIELHVISQAVQAAAYAAYLKAQEAAEKATRK
jgi:hypothetical protein